MRDDSSRLWFVALLLISAVNLICAVRSVDPTESLIGGFVAGLCFMRAMDIHL